MGGIKQREQRPVRSEDRLAGLPADVTPVESGQKGMVFGIHWRMEKGGGKLQLVL